MKDRLGYSLLLALFLFIMPARAAKIVSDTINSRLLGTKVFSTIVLPDRYASEVAKGTRFPVLYLLHCAGCDDKTWLESGPEGADVASLIDSVNMIVVAPSDGNTLSWWIDSPVRSASNFSSFIALELRNRIDSLYATCRSRTGRGLSGHSMGGYGSIYNLRQHANLFGAAYSFKGCTDLETWSNRFGIGDVVGDVSFHKARYDTLTLLGREQSFLNLPEFRLFICNGKNDAWFFQENRQFSANLKSLGIAHQYEEIPEDHFMVRRIRMEHILTWFDTYFKENQSSCSAQKIRTPTKNNSLKPRTHSSKTRLSIAGRSISESNHQHRPQITVEQNSGTATR